jgi:hypothetical protein
MTGGQTKQNDMHQGKTGGTMAPPSKMMPRKTDKWKNKISSSKMEQDKMDTGMTSIRANLAKALRLPRGFAADRTSRTAPRA